MKKLFIIAAAACVALASCVKNEPVQTPEFGDEISFETPIVAPATKADPSPVAFTGDDFGVWAHHSTDQWVSTNLVDQANAYISNQKITGTGNPKTWTATGKYWLKEKYLHFIAYAPHSASGVSVSGAGIAYTAYTISPKADDAAGVSPATDIMFSERVVNQKAGPVDLVFNHALTALNFKAQKSTGPSFAITKIVVKNVNSVGNFSQGLTAAFNATSVARDSKVDGVVGGWTTSTPVNYVVYNDEAFTLNTTPQTLGSEILLLPQVLGATSEIEVFYTMDGVEMSTTCSLKDTQWSRGYRYTYTISFGAAEITFTPYEVEWTGTSKEATIG